jgi:hypothetical protein
MSDSVLMPIPSSRIDTIIPNVIEMLNSAVESANGRFTLDDAIRHFKEKDWVLWTSVRDKKIEAIAATEILQYPQKKMCAVRIVTGKNYANWVQLENGIAAWAQSIGCDGMEAYARKGWAKIFTQYNCSHVFLERMF